MLLWLLRKFRTSYDPSFRRPFKPWVGGGDKYKKERDTYNYWGKKRWLKYRRTILINKIVDYFDPFSIRNLSKDEEFKGSRYELNKIKPLKDHFNG